MPECGLHLGFDFLLPIGFESLVYAHSLSKTGSFYLQCCAQVDHQDFQAHDELGDFLCSLVWGIALAKKRASNVIYTSRKMQKEEWCFKSYDVLLWFRDHKSRPQIARPQEAFVYLLFLISTFGSIVAQIMGSIYGYLAYREAL